MPVVQTSLFMELNRFAGVRLQHLNVLLLSYLKERLIYITENCLFQVYHHCVAPDSGHDNKTRLTASPESVMSTVMTVSFFLRNELIIW